MTTRDWFLVRWKTYGERSWNYGTTSPVRNRRMVLVSAELARGCCVLADGTAILCRCMGMYNLQAGAAIPWKDSG
jgi:dTDP-4-dehydrorhamnose 3,5-epimerase-like enzyme